MEDQSLLLGMLKDETESMLISKLSTEQQNELFFFQKFNMKEKSGLDTKKFVGNLIDDFYKQNNQFVPFAKVENGYVQCIQDPNVDDGFITVQLTKCAAPTANTRNLDKKKYAKVSGGGGAENGEDFYELQTDEATEA